MASIVIVSDQCYLLAEAINYIVINEVDDANDREWTPRTLKQRKMRNRNPNKYAREYALERKPYHININFIPKNQPPLNGSSMSPSSRKSNDECTSVSIMVHGYKNALTLFQDIVSQLRDQIPDELYLNKLVEDFLTSTEEK